MLWQAADGTGAAESLATFDAPVTQVEPVSWSPDGALLVVRVSIAPLGTDIGIVTVGEPDSYRPLIATAADELNGQISPDGRWIAYVSDETGRLFPYLVKHI